MATTAEVQSGKGYIYGIAAIVFTFQTSKTIGGNASNITVEDLWDESEMPSQDGATVEGLIASKRRRRYTMDFSPSSSSKSGAKGEMDDLLGGTPNMVITISSESHTGLNGTYNFKGGMRYQRQREGGPATCSITLEQYETTTEGTFGALAVIS